MSPDNKLKNELKLRIESYHPDIVFCQLLGCLIFIALLNQGFEIQPETRIILTHADVDKVLFAKISSLQMHIFYSLFDIVFWVSRIVNLLLATGLKSVQGVCNISVESRWYNIW
jgi:hypothetical protein